MRRRFFREKGFVRSSQVEAIGQSYELWLQFLSSLACPCPSQSRQDAVVRQGSLILRHSPTTSSFE